MHSDKRLAGHMFPHHDHVGIHFFTVLPKLIHQNGVTAVGVVAHYHVFIQVCHIVVRLLTVFGGVLLRYLLFNYHGEHIRKRNNAPAVYHPVEHIYDILRLNTPDYAAVAVLGGHHGFILVALRNELHNLIVDFVKFGVASAVAHVVGAVI